MKAIIMTALLSMLLLATGYSTASDIQVQCFTAEQLTEQVAKTNESATKAYRAGVVDTQNRMGEFFDQQCFGQPVGTIILKNPTTGASIACGPTVEPEVAFEEPVPATLE